MADTEMIRVKEGDTVKLIPRSDFKDDLHEHVPLNKPAPTPAAAAPGPGGAKNPSGTFSEPTPTDVRYPNKDATEFENNHGAFLRKSAAQIREDAGLPDAPGGIYPDGHIPDDWETLPEEKRIDLANRVSSRTDVTAAQANDLIKAEAERRKSDPEWQKKRAEGDSRRSERRPGADNVAASARLGMSPSGRAPVK